LDTPNVRVRRGERESDVQVMVFWFVSLRSCRHWAVLDVNGGLRGRRDLFGIDTGLFDQFAQRGSDQRGVSGFEVASGLQQDPVRTMIDQQDIGAAADQ